MKNSFRHVARLLDIKEMRKFMYHLIHPSVREQQSWVFMWNRRRGGDEGMFVLLHKEIYEHLS